MSTPNPDIRYPRLVRRLQAALIDFLIFVAIFIGFGTLLSTFDFSGAFKAALFAFVILILEPGLVCVTGGTIGHHAMGLKIQDQQTGRKLNVFFALLRFLSKFALGWLSFAIITLTKRHQAFHDLASNSIVIIRNPIGKGGLAEQHEREVYLPEFEYPIWYRRVMIIMLYVAATFIPMVVLFFFLLSDQCIEQDRCTAAERLIENLSSIAWLGCGVALLALGWTGRLPGARRKPRAI